MLITDKEKIIDLDPFCDRKSFYGKCKCIEYPTKNLYVLISYQTIVATYDAGGFHRKWGGYSRTTSRHVDAFRVFLGLRKIGKSEWESLEVE